MYPDSNRLFQFRNALPRQDIVPGVLIAEGVSTDTYATELVELRDRIVGEAQQPWSPEREQRRTDVRNMLRYGTYKPTGRAKPATEYLLRAVQDGSFPQINPVVDVANLLGLDSLLPVSVWDLDLAASNAYTLRYGRPDEAYVFNSAGQTIALQDLLVLARDEDDQPLVNPVKDSLATKTIPQTTRIGVIVYAPLAYTSELPEVLDQYAAGFRACGKEVQIASGVLHPAEVLVLRLA